MEGTLLRELQNQDKQFRVYGGGEQTDIDTQFASRSVSVTHETLPPGAPDPFVVIEEHGEFAGAISVSDFQELLEPPIVRPGERDDIPAGYRVLVDLLDETVFTSLERRQLLAVSREIEDRALRVGSGTLRASFQTFSRFEPQMELYRRLAAETDLDIHVSGVEDWTPPDIPGLTYHPDTEGRLERYWMVAFDGGPQEIQACGLVATERRDEYDGVWTYDSGKVETILSTLRTV
jgi:hypothetical protein